jgi:hypothetical protein
MMPEHYVAGLNAIDGDRPGVYGVRHARQPASWRIICSYEDGIRHKSALFGAMAAGGQAEAAGRWEWHHVVERQHYADIDFDGRLEVLYRSELPCVLLINTEHRAYNRLLHITETDELHRDHNLPADLLVRSRTVAAAARNLNQHPALRARVSALRQLYRDAYEGDPVLIRIADNVFDDAQRKLR